jgi:hypothetical protein
MTKAFLFSLRYHDRAGAAFKRWLTEGTNTGLWQGEALVSNLIDIGITDANYAADEILRKAKEACWLVDIGYHPSFSQRAFSSLECRKGSRDTPAYSYPREHSWERVRDPHLMVGLTATPAMEELRSFLQAGDPAIWIAEQDAKMRETAA